MNLLLDAFRTADRVLITVGGGFSYDAGLHFRDRDLFRRLFPSLIPLGLTRFQDIVSYHEWPAEQEWAFMAHYEAFIRTLIPNPLYTDLLALLQHLESKASAEGRDWDWFLITTNSDGLFRHHGFPPEKYYEKHGSFENLQCMKVPPCCHDVWPSWPILEKIVPHVDPQVKCSITDPDLVPRCRNCGGPAWFNGSGGPWYFNDKFEEAEQRYRDFVRDAVGGDPAREVVILECGVGFANPSGLRWPNERLVRRNENVRLFRINPNRKDFEVPKEIADKCVCVETTGMPLVQALKSEFGENENENEEEGVRE